MSRLLLASNKIASRSDLKNDDLVQEMLEEAKAEGAKGAPTKESVIQSLTVEDISKLPETVKQKIVEDAKVSKEGGERSVLRQMRENRI